MSNSKWQIDKSGDQLWYYRHGYNEEILRVRPGLYYIYAPQKGSQVSLIFHSEYKTLKAAKAAAQEIK